MQRYPLFIVARSVPVSNWISCCVSCNCSRELFLKQPPVLVHSHRRAYTHTHVHHTRREADLVAPARELPLVTLHTLPLTLRKIFHVRPKDVGPVPSTGKLFTKTHSLRFLREIHNWRISFRIWRDLNDWNVSWLLLFERAIFYSILLKYSSRFCEK